MSENGGRYIEKHNRRSDIKTTDFYNIKLMLRFIQSGGFMIAKLFSTHCISPHNVLLDNN